MVCGGTILCPALVYIGLLGRSPCSFMSRDLSKVMAFGSIVAVVARLGSITMVRLADAAFTKSSSMLPVLCGYTREGLGLYNVTSVMSMFLMGEGAMGCAYVGDKAT